jgi:L-rhamnose mutarotase
MKVALHSILREGQEAAYEREHATVWPELVEIMRGVGIQDWSIWRSGRHLFHLVEVDDFATAMAALADDPVNERWQRHMATFVDHFEGPSGEEGGGRPLAHVWTLAEQPGQST